MCCAIGALLLALAAAWRRLRAGAEAARWVAAGAGIALLTASGAALAAGPAGAPADGLAGLALHICGFGIR
jgi:hypothetical protein